MDVGVYLSLCIGVVCFLGLILFGFKLDFDLCFADSCGLVLVMCGANFGVALFVLLFSLVCVCLLVLLGFCFVVCIWIADLVWLTVCASCVVDLLIDAFVGLYFVDCWVTCLDFALVVFGMLAVLLIVCLLVSSLFVCVCLDDALVDVCDWCLVFALFVFILFSWVLLCSCVLFLFVLTVVFVYLVGVTCCLI